ncbi:MAG: Mrp/NBP35 family ATP-binding protein [Lachnospiraceae bacterium]|nr:Mrp/NBP35 family ATP-binding protein [Lachnospiraceae bacterium]MDD7078052.1 Mrp/NBP35 family ATP-binding protein [Lachnospiraceae bacterium]MDY3728983.1 Mrp/NBP35 family ATP-binding protein [Candidatus Choladocola sp.]
MAEKSCSSSSCSKESCEGCPSANKPQSFLEELNVYSEIKHVIGIVSGKGGVGKSMATASLANLLAAKGYRVGIMDADITGPSIPRMYGLTGPAEAGDEGIYPVMTDNDIKVMSINLLMPDPEMPVIWRGPVLANMVKQFWTDVIWGELDYLLVDMPPGTGDVPLTVFQSLPVDGIVIVTSPQDLVKMIVKKAYNMAETMKIPVLGVIENYSYLKCPDCGKEIPVFGKSKIDEVAKDMGVLVLGKMPIDPKLTELSDEGEFAKAENPYLDNAIQALQLLNVKGNE